MVNLRNTLKNARGNRVSAQGLEGSFTHKLQGSFSGHGNNLMPTFCEKTKEHYRFICGNAPSNTNDNAHGIYKRSLLSGVVNNNLFKSNNLFGTGRNVLLLNSTEIGVAQT